MPSFTVLILAAIAAGSLTITTSRARHSVSGWSPDGGSMKDSVVGVFEGRTPCGPIATSFTGFPAENCEKIKWRLTLYRNPGNGAPTLYRYEGTRTSHQGRWRIATAGNGQTSRTVYHLTPDRGGLALSLLSVEDKVLLLLDANGGVLVGDASWSYVLNRIDRPAQ